LIRLACTDFEYCNDMTSTHLDIFSLIFPAARVDFRPEHAHLLASKAAGFTAWEGFIPAVEKHGMAPLFNRNAVAAGIELPEDITFRLRGLVLRHRLAEQARTRCLVEILQAANTAGIEVVLLKGAAMAHLVYPEPGLRPMRDMDLLARPDQAAKLQSLLMGMGYKPAEEAPWDHQHLSGLVKQVEGFTISLEVHHHVFHFSWRGRAANVEEWMDRARPFFIEGIPAKSLAPEEMLWHAYQHMISGPIRLIAVADMINLTEELKDEIDWDRLEWKYPQVLNVLALFHPHSPFSGQVVEAANITRRNGNIPLGEDLQGWSHINSGMIRVIGLWKFIKLTFTPSDWWLYLYFGADQHRSIWPYRYFFYPLDRCRLISQRVFRHFGHFDK
jgi:hypothetical protein